MDLHPVSRSQGSRGISGFVFQAKRNTRVKRHFHFHWRIGLKVDGFVGAMDTQRKSVLAHCHHFTPLEVRRGLEIEPGGLIKITPQPRPDRFGKSCGVHHAPVDDADRTELEHLLVNRFTDLRLAPKLSTTDIVVVINLYREMSECIFLFSGRGFDRRHFSTKSRRGAPNRPHCQHEGQGYGNQSTHSFHYSGDAGGQIGLSQSVCILRLLIDLSEWAN